MDQYYDETLSRMATSGSGSNPTTSSSGSESESGEQSPEWHQKSPYTQSAAAQLMEPRIYPGVTRPSPQAFAFDFDFDSDVWISTGPYAQFGNAHPKDTQAGWSIQELGFPESFA